MKPRMRFLLTQALIIALYGCNDAVHVMHEEYVRHGDSETYLGGACEEVDHGVTSSGGVAGDSLQPFEFELTAEDDGVRAVLRADDDSGRKVERSYSTSSLRSGRRDTLELKLDENATVKVIIWGDESCKPIRDLDQQE